MAQSTPAEMVKAILARPIQLCDQVKKAADESSQSVKTECAELKAKTERLAGLLRQAARIGSDLYERPARRMLDEAEQGLDKALALTLKSRASAGIVHRLFTINPTAAFKKVAVQLENSIGDISWLLAVSSPDHRGDDDYLGLPPIAANEPILCMIWENIAILLVSWSTLDARAEAAANLASLAKNNDRYGKLIIEEGGIGPLVRLIKETSAEGQENATRALGLLARDPESVQLMIEASVCNAFAKILKEGSMKTQSVVAWAVAELASNSPLCQEACAKSNIIRLLVSHLAFETVEEHYKYNVPLPSKSAAGGVNNTMSSMHSVVLANASLQQQKKAGGINGHLNADELQSKVPPHPMGSVSSARPHMHSVVQSTMAAGGHLSDKTPSAKSAPVAAASNNKAALGGSSIKGREYEDPATKAAMKEMAATALWKLATGNPAVCRSITESRALLCFAILLEKGSEDVRLCSAMALMEIAAVAEKDAELRRSGFKPSSPAAKAVVDQLLKIVERADSKLLVPCVKAIGCLARTFRATENRIIAPLVKLLDERETDVMKEAVQALVKFADTDNYLRVDHSKAILDAGGARHLVQLVYFGGAGLQVDALVLLCYIAQHVPDSEALAQAEVLTVLEWAFKQAALVKDEMVQSLLPMATALLVFQTRGKRDIVELLLLRGSTVIEGSAQESLTISDVSLEEEEFDVKDYEKESSHENTYNQDILPIDLPENNPIDTQNKLLDYDGNNGESKSMAISNCEAQGQQMDKINLVAYETTPTDTSSDTLHSFTEGHLSYKDKQRLKIFNLIKDAVNDLKEASVFETLDIEKELRQLLDIGCRYDIQVQPLHSLLNEVSRLNESFSLDELDKHTLAKETLEKQNIILSSQMVDLRSTWDATEERLNYITQRLKELHDEEQSTTDFLVLQQSQIEQVQKAIVANEEALDVASSHIEALRARSTMAEDEFKALVNNFTFELAI